MEVLPIPPAPIRAIGIRRCAKQTIFSINSSRPKKILGDGGGNSPGALDANVKHWSQTLNLSVVEITDLFWV